MGENLDDINTMSNFCRLKWLTSSNLHCRCGLYDRSCLHPEQAAAYAEVPGLDVASPYANTVMRGQKHWALRYHLQASNVRCAARRRRKASMWCSHQCFYMNSRQNSSEHSLERPTGCSNRAGYLSIWSCPPTTRWPFRRVLSGLGLLLQQ